MIRLMAPRCPDRYNPPNFRVLMCRAHTQGCGRSWTANGHAQLVAYLAERNTHEALCAASAPADFPSPTSPDASATPGAPSR